MDLVPDAMTFLPHRLDDPDIRGAEKAIQGAALVAWRQTKDLGPSLSFMKRARSLRNFQTTLENHIQMTIETQTGHRGHEGWV